MPVAQRREHEGWVPAERDATQEDGQGPDSPFHKANGGERVQRLRIVLTLYVPTSLASGCPSPALHSVSAVRRSEHMAMNITKMGFTLVGACMQGCGRNRQPAEYWTPAHSARCMDDHPVGNTQGAQTAPHAGTGLVGLSTVCLRHQRSGG